MTVLPGWVGHYSKKSTGEYDTVATYVFNEALVPVPTAMAAHDKDFSDGQKKKQEVVMKEFRGALRALEGTRGLSPKKKAVVTHVILEVGKVSANPEKALADLKKRIGE